MATVRDGINALTAFIIERYDNGRFSAFLDLIIEEDETAQTALGMALADAGAGPALLFAVGSGSMDEEQQSELLRGLQGQIEAVNALADWRRGGLDDFQAIVGADANRFIETGDAALDIVTKATKAADAMTDASSARVEDALADVVIAALAAASSHDVALREALAKRLYQLTTDN